MSDVLVTGGTGHLGRDIVRLLKARGDRVRVLARTPGPDPDVEWIIGDLSTGAGVPDAVGGARTVVHAATFSPAAQRGYLRPGDFFRSPPEVDIDGTRRLLAASAGALLARMLDTMAGRRIWPLPSNLPMQPGDAADFAEYVVECVGEGPGGVRAGFGGPQTLTLVELARQYQAARGIRGRIAGLPLPGVALRAAGPQTCPDGRHGTTTWAEWLARR